jgi:hypothetical protein
MKGSGSVKTYGLPMARWTAAKKNDVETKNKGTVLRKACHRTLFTQPEDKPLTQEQ